MQYNFNEIEKRIKEFWNEKAVYKVSKDSEKPKCYVLDMFPYPSGAGLHVGHPLGYVASDIYARYKRMKGFNVLHPMGFDAFGLPAEQYALETGQHPALTTEKNIARYKEQLNNIGFCYDWTREIRTSDPKYYKWTQWIFLQLFKSWFNQKTQKAEPLTTLIAAFEQSGNNEYPAPGDEILHFSAKEWKNKTEARKRDVLMQYRLAYLDYAVVWWCEALGTVLANDEVVNGLSERGGHPVEKKKMRQWFLRITEFADRLQDSLENLEWSDAMKEMQRNWIGRSEGAEVTFQLKGLEAQIKVFTTRPDTIFGVDFMVLAPEHNLVSQITTEAQKSEVDKYVAYVKSRSERERMTEKKISGCFTGAFAEHPFSNKKIPVWISEYVLAGYGTGAIMAVPSGDDRDHTFARHFQIPITNIFGEKYTGDAAVTDKNVFIKNSSFINGLPSKKAAEVVLQKLEKEGLGKSKVNYKIRDAGFSRQRYWGEPFPIVYKNDIPYALDEAGLDLPENLQQLPLELPHVENYKPGPKGEGPLANIKDWVYIQNKKGETLKRETNTMPGYAGSSWYFLRYMDPKNETEFAAKDNTDYWNQVDLYIGGTEHAVGHLLYSRMWTKVLHDLGFLSFDEPFKKLLNQGMIQGKSFYVSGATYQNENYQIDKIYSYVEDLESLPQSIEYKGETLSVSMGSTLYPQKQTFQRRLKFAHNYLDSQGRLSDLKYNQLNKENNGAGNFHPEEIDWKVEVKNGERYLEGMVIEKMSKSKYNVVNPDDIIAQYGADTFRMYEMFLGPIEISKPWDTKGIEGVHRFLKKFWRLFYNENPQSENENSWIVTDETPTKDEFKILHKTIKKITEDTERFSFNTAVSQFMICVNELSDINCHKEAILDPLVRLITPYAPHIAEELWQKLGHEKSVTLTDFPKFEKRYVIESSKEYPIAINGKTRTTMSFALDAGQSMIEEAVLKDKIVQKWLAGKNPKRVIYVKGRMINVVV